ncbi:hypothetical protein ASPBRDRAFT_359422 [Aspergillus brasiliensis CBS 101740]|uniref:Uncharacterized protein n=1 Tax=Aspergillus brasiliensis (strain CBS 101740 / IMI 381727 / IBT 21946) TaxID=767769 RepID=A0A1L9U5R9_ASPBC|nr:hypothetical protein ASPBRDRAFT_359422 [Aspergillus brasiliensis CBS 101740]
MAPSTRRPLLNSINSQQERPAAPAPPSTDLPLPSTGSHVRSTASISHSRPPKRIVPLEPRPERAPKTARTETGRNSSSQTRAPLREVPEEDMNMRGPSFSEGQDSGGLFQPEPTLREASVPAPSFSVTEPNPDSQTSGSGDSQSYRQSPQEWLFGDYDEPRERILPQPRPAVSIPSSDRIKILQSSADAFERVTLCARRQFIAMLDNTRVTWPVEQVFPDLSANREIYKNAVTRVCDLYKTWI